MDRVIKVWNYQFYLGELLVITLTFLAMENIFSWLLYPVSEVLLNYEKILTILIFAYLLYEFRALKTNEKVYLGLFTAFILKLVFESMIHYGNFFEQLTLFSILFPVVFAIYVKFLCRSLQIDFLPFISRFYLYLYLVFMLIYGRQFSFSLNEIEMKDYGPFSGDSRIIHARSIFMLILPMLYYLNQVVIHRHSKSLVPLMICLAAILIHQHRSVWASTMVALLIMLFASYRNRFINLSRLYQIMLVCVLIICFAGFILSAANPHLIDFFGQRAGEILDPNREGTTGEFREQQRLVYFQYVVQRPFFGWTFEGFNMPNPLVDWWPAKSGQHFHEGYMEMLFYHGIVGLLFKYIPIVYLLIKAFSKKLSQQSVILIAFCVSGLIFSLSYVLPLVYWGVVGMCFYQLEQDRIEQNDQELVQPPLETDEQRYILSQFALNLNLK